MLEDNKSISVNALFGGTFDPPHFGHLKPLQETADILNLTTVSLMPANVPALKSEVSEGHHRIEMTRLLCELDPRFILNLTEFERSGKSYTVDTLERIKQKKPLETIVFIIGLDSLLSINKWYKWEQLFDLCHIVVMLRPPLGSGAALKTVNEEVALKLYKIYTSVEEFDQIVGSTVDRKTRRILLSKMAFPENNLQGINQASFMDIIQATTEGKLWFVKNKALSVSSTEIRQQLKVGSVSKDLVPLSVMDYIHKHKLYKN